MTPAQAAEVAATLHVIADVIGANPVLAPAVAGEAFVLTVTDARDWDRATDALIAAGNPSWHRSIGGEYETCTLHLEGVSLAVQAAASVLDQDAAA